MTDNPRLRRIRELLEQHFNPVRLEIEDDSWRHAGHTGAARHGGGHFNVTIVAAAFAGKSRVECHRMVMRLLQPLFDDDIHAVTIRATAPDE